MTDPLDIINEFMQRPLEVPAFPYDDHWQNKVAALCEEIARLRNENVRLKERKEVLEE